MREKWNEVALISTIDGSVVVVVHQFFLSTLDQWNEVRSFEKTFSNMIEIECLVTSWKTNGFSSRERKREKKEVKKVSLEQNNCGCLCVEQISFLSFPSDRLKLQLLLLLFIEHFQHPFIDRSNEFQSLMNERWVIDVLHIVIIHGQPSRKNVEPWKMN